MSAIGENIAYFRRKKGYTQKDLAEKTGLSRSFISQIENDSNSPSDDSLFKIANVLNVSIESLKDNGKNYIRNEDVELIMYLIKLTADLVIKWEVTPFTTEMYSDIFYLSEFQGVTYRLIFEEKGIGESAYYYNIDLEINSDDLEDTYIISSNYSTSNFHYLNELINTIVEIDRDKSPIFKIINNIESYIKDKDKEE